MDPYDEQRLRAEVIYLHSLWHRGPPSPRSTSTNNTNGFLHQLSNPTQFKRQRAKPQRGNWSKRNQEVFSTESIQDSGKEWPCNQTSNNAAPSSAWPAQSNSQLSWHSSESGKEWPCNPNSDTQTHTSSWPTVTTRQNSQTILLSPEQKAQLAANRAQAKALKATQDYFRSNNSDDDDDEIGDDDDDDEDLGKDDRDDSEGEENEDRGDLTEEGYGAEKYRFFVKVFEEDSDLREYYQKNYQNGDFNCLVCWGVGMKKASKRFKDCVALIQHSVSIAKTKKRRAHRAYGKAICKVLGWDISKLPTIVSALSANDGVSLSNSGISESEGEAQGHVVDETKDNPNVLSDTEAQADVGNGDELQENESTADTWKGDTDPHLTAPNMTEDEGSGRPSDLENSSIAADTSKGDVDPNLTAPNIAEDEGSGQPSDVDTVVGHEGTNVVSLELVKDDLKRII